MIQVGNPAYNRMEDQSGSSQISIAGGPVRGNNYLIDGVPITDANNRAIIIPSLEAVQEVKIQANTYDAEMARTGGGMFNTLMRSGSNSYPRQRLRPPAPHRLGRQQLLQQRGGHSDHRSAQRHLGRQLRRPRFGSRKSTTARTRHSSPAAIEQYDDTQSASSTFSAPTALERTGDFSKTLTRTALCDHLRPVHAASPFPAT